MVLTSSVMKVIYEQHLQFLRKHNSSVQGRASKELSVLMEMGS
jgi:hypothetical protein